MNSQEYWIKREKEWQKQQIKDDKSAWQKLKVACNTHKMRYKKK